MEYCDHSTCAEFKPCRIHSIVFALNGETVSLPLEQVDPLTTLVEYLRSQTPFQGTKVGCLEGGCGACTVVLERIDPATKARVTLSVNACLRPLAACDGWSITTTEGLGGSRKGFHPIQERMANLNGIQCGFCTPGMVMALYGTLNSPEAANGVSMAQMETSLDGNICRCTGYRAILDVAKSFARDSNVVDTVCKSTLGTLEGKVPSLPDVVANFKQHRVSFARDGVQWVRPTSIEELLAELATAHNNSQRVRIVAGGTGFAFDKSHYSRLIDIQAIPELFESAATKEGLRVGAATTLNNFIRLLQNHSSKSTGFPELKKVLARVANTHVRNVGSLVGNLMLAKTIGFVSDLAPALTALQATVTLRNSSGTTEFKMREFLSSPQLPPVSIVESVFIPYLSATEHFRAYKLAARRVMAHADVNGSFFVDVQKNVIKRATVVFGGFDDAPTVSANVEAFLQNKEVNTEVLRDAVALVGGNTEVETLVYKFLTSLLPADKIPADVAAGLEDFTRPVSSSSQSFSFPNTHSPVSEPIQEVSNKIKAAGEARFVDDLPVLPRTLHGYLVLAPAAAGTLVKIEEHEALKMPGVHSFIGADKVTGANNIGTLGDPVADPLFVAIGGDITFFSQPVGMILADSLPHARRAAEKVRVTVDKKEPVLTFEKSRHSNALVSNEYKVGDADAELAKADASRTFSGRVLCNSQQHFYMEPQSSYATPDEDGKLTVHCSMQWPGMVQNGISQVLGVKSSDVNIVHRRAGGGFGGKLVHPIRFACAAALAARTTGRPVKVIADRSVDLQLVGGREEIYANYTGTFDETGVVTAIKIATETNAGNTLGLSWFANFVVASQSSGLYNWKNYHHKADVFRSNVVGRSAMRAPGDLAACYIAETIIDHVAHLLKITPEIVRERNFFSFNPSSPDELKLVNGKPMGHWTMPRLWPQLKAKVNFEAKQKEVADFNAANRWRQRGISLMPIRYEVKVWQRQAMVNIYGDGAVLVTQDGCEIGQGLYTKVIQACSYSLGTLLGPNSVPMDMIRMGDTATYTIPNAFFSGGSTTSEGACQAVRQCCDELIVRMKPSLEKLRAEKQAKEGDAAKVTWAELCAAANGAGVHLSVTSRFGSEDITYQNLGVAFSQVELNALTGEVQVLNADILYDCGKSLNPAIDIGQAEGGFVMGLGYYFTEKVHITQEGRLKSNNTWNYKVPLASDIPINFTIELLQDSGFEKGILSSKAVGEPPLTLATGTVLAVKQALYACRAKNGLQGYVELPVPATRSDLLRLCGTQAANLTF